MSHKKDSLPDREELQHKLEEAKQRQRQHALALKQAERDAMEASKALLESLTQELQSLPPATQLDAATQSTLMKTLEAQRELCQHMGYSLRSTASYRQVGLALNQYLATLDPHLKMEEEYRSVASGLPLRVEFSSEPLEEYEYDSFESVEDILDLQDLDVESLGAILEKVATHQRGSSWQVELRDTYRWEDDWYLPCAVRWERSTAGPWSVWQGHRYQMLIAEKISSASEALRCGFRNRFDLYLVSKPQHEDEGTKRHLHVVK